MPVADLPGVRTRRATQFRRLGVETVSDLLRHLPIRYEYEAPEGRICDLQVDMVGTVRGEIVNCRWIPGRGKSKSRFEATLSSGNRYIKLTWFNAHYLSGRLHPGMSLRVKGKPGIYKRQLEMVNPKWEELDDPEHEPERTERLRPVYPATDGLNSEQIEKLIGQVLPHVLPQIQDPLPAALTDHHAMPVLATAIKHAHQPVDMDQAGAARRRLAYNELLLLQLGMMMKRAYVRDRLTAPALRFSEAIDKHIRGRFPFELTDSQNKVIEEIVNDLTCSRPMNRLLQGDVGSGKTVVALYAMLMAVAARRQAAIMAPTELLAEQHYHSIAGMLTGSNVRLGLLTSGQSTAGSVQRAALLAQIETGEIDIIIGTHALVTESVRFHDLAVAVIDEQHRFGVVQRSALRDSNGKIERDKQGRFRVPHHLIMTATPIPRTLSLTIFGDLDVSTIRHLPPGRSAITSSVTHPDKSDEVYRFLADRLKAGGQGYVVVPAIDAGENEGTVHLKSVREHARMLQEEYCTGLRVAAIHGRLKRNTREVIMERFRRGEIHLLVATTVIEVGVDVPNATVMVIEHAERFGLAQLHQLRGRIGRGTHARKSVCVFIADPSTEEAARRMKAVAATTDGFKIAERDLEIRGMGDFFGTRQHGLPMLRVATIPGDIPLLQLARRDATQIIDKDPTLKGNPYLLLKKVLLQQYGEALGLADVG